jgi:uncharacterized protein YcbK (DUF882 family)
MIYWQYVKHFKEHEFASPDLAGSGNRMNPLFVHRLDALREQLKRPFVINSGYRSPEHNKKIGGAPRSAHVEGLAVDISVRRWSREEKRDLVLYARQLGFNGVGISPTFIHLDMKPRLASWIYKGRGQEAIPLGREVEYL